jgi:cold shock CspA family protein
MKYQAIISTYFPARKFGFLKQSDGSTVFFHATNFEAGVPRLGEKVEFELGDPVKLGKPQQAVNVVSIPSDDTFGSLATSTAATEGGK